VNDSLTLYRGDFSEIDEFRTHKSFKSCLLGRGIYLTNNTDVANSYREKGADWRAVRYNDARGVVTLFSGEALNRDEANKKAFKVYCGYGVVKESVPKGMSKANVERFLQDQFRDMLESREIISEYQTVSVPDKNTRFGVRYVKHIVVKWDTKRYIGHLSKFVFPLKDFNNAILHVDRPCRDSALLEVVWEYCPSLKMTEDETCEEFVRRNLGQPIMFNRRRVPWERLKSAVEPYGYRGFEYDGGRRLGMGGHKHRAFCVWDDEWVNAHRVRH